MTAPMTAERLAELRREVQGARDRLSRTNATGSAYWWHEMVAELLAEVERLTREGDHHVANDRPEQPPAMTEAEVAAHSLDLLGWRQEQA